ncbi:uncharacterized protein K452DRAFT_301105 [Aplosporella prunicola CBS 121167]|uniref:Malate dehydrogenase n=1 Tax=Aplosporella prunicola CBS 121167 TaxID=1176127 RepID=A0A6A6B581_9PEZI|nr:uncharacterized protein K452DRAFT_301105 [Aplosporella prunicola CBS 121167]KAF2138573.1 hypothetical protein K452DRAFT_301105 [Aplosporella prunicola CBS 121167]
MAPRKQHSLLSILAIFLLTTLATPFPFIPPPARRSTTPTLPSSTLPQPATGLKLKYIALGIGTQNYTCASSADNTKRTTSTPSSAGALATLYDITPLLLTPYGTSLAPALAPLALALFGLDHLAPASSPDAVWQRLIAQLLLPTDMQPSRLGTHYFGAYGGAGGTSPMWALDGAGAGGEGDGVLFVGVKEGSATAPVGACKGLGGEGAVDWLFLGEAEAEKASDASQSKGEQKTQKRAQAQTSDGGIRAVYRVETAGGMQPASCEGVEDGAFEVAYAAQYWFYGVDEEGEKTC